MIVIVSGPSCAGKSTFMQSHGATELTGLTPAHPVVFPATLWLQPAVLHTDCYFHYNILRPADRGGDGFASDGPWNDLLAHPAPKRAIILLAPRSVLIDRMSRRETIEPPTFTGGSTMPYPQRHWIDLLGRIDVHATYRKWCEELDRRGIPYTLLDSTTDAYRHTVGIAPALNA
jgi:hypothetical protein